MNAIEQNGTAAGRHRLPHIEFMDASDVMPQEDKVGIIEVGKEADLIILDRNLLETSIDQISDTKVLEPYSQGELIYQ